MEAADFSSARELDHFAGVGARIDARVREAGGASLLALSMGGTTLERDFAVLEIAHLLAKNGKSVLVADCDFLHPGLSGLVENLEDHGFLDLLLYGSSLKSVAKTVGIDGVTVAGPGSFPVSRTIPFALKEFDKIRDFLRSKHDVVVYCSTLHTEDGRVNPLVSLVDGVLVACRIENLAEGELEKHLASLGAERPPSRELVCFCGGREEEPAAAPARPAPAAERDIPRIEPEPESAADEIIAAPLMEHAADETVEPAGGRGGRRFSLLRIAFASGAVLVAVFVVWWIAMNRTVREPSPQGERPSVATAPPGAAADSAAGSAAAVDESVSDTAAPIDESVSDTAAPPGPAVEPEPAIPAGPAKYTLHVASFTDAARADEERKILEKNGFSVRIVEVPIRGEQWLRVFAGAYATMEEADRARLEILGLKGHGYARIVEMDRTDR
jgi:cell division septation protein DedD